MFSPLGRGLFLALILTTPAAGSMPQSAQTPAQPPAAAALTTAQIVSQMETHNQARARALKHYHSTRHYSIEYRGFPENLAAGIVVEADYDAAFGKSFKIVSQTGSNFLAQKVLKRAVDSEQEASKDMSSAALTTANYKFNLLGNETLARGPAYILNVEPLRPSKFLYRGKIWVDAADFAVVKMDTQPAKNPSIWISRTLIHCTNVDVGGFRLPEKLRSETKVRIGGEAVLTIDYGKYDVEATH